VRSMFMSDVEDAGPLETTFGVRVAAALTGLGTLGIGIFPEPFLRFAGQSLIR